LQLNDFKITVGQGSKIAIEPSQPRLEKMRPAGQMWPAWTFNMARTKNCVILYSTHHWVRTKLCDKQVLERVNQKN